MSISVFANKKLMFRVGENTYTVEPHILGTAPDWIAKDPYFEMALKDGSLTSTDYLSKKQKIDLDNGEFNKPGSIQEEQPQEPQEIDLDNMEVEQLKSYAELNNIDLGKATSKDRILAKIKEAENK